MGAKNHAVLMSDGEFLFLDSRLLLITCVANKNLALNSIIGAAFGGKASLVVLCGRVNCVHQLPGRDAWLSLWVSISRRLGDLKFKVYISVVLVRAAQSWLPELIERARKLQVNGGFENGADLYALSIID